MAPLRSPIYSRLFLGVTCLLFVFIVVALREPTLYQLWNLPLGGWAMPQLADTRVVLAAADVLNANGGWFSWEDLIARGEIYNYPRLWAYVGWLGLGEKHLVGVGLAMSALFLFCQYRLLRPTDGKTLAVGALILFSPSSMLLLERSNNDILIFALVFAATTLLAGTSWFRQGAGAGLLLLASCLKLYPIAAIAAMPWRGWRRSGVVAGVLVALFAVYVFAVRDDLRRVSVRTPRPFFGAYGAMVFTSFIGQSKALPAAMVKVGVDWTSPGRRAAAEGMTRNVSLVAMLLVGGIALLIGLRSTGWGPGAVPTDRELALFQAGAAIYGGTFVIGNNWEYRLVFLTLTVPLLNGWLRGGEPALRRRAGVTLGVIIVCLWGFAVPLTAATFALKQLANWTLFAFLTFGFGLLLPVNLRDPLRRALGRGGAGAAAAGGA